MYKQMAQALVNAGFQGNKIGEFQASWKANVSFRTFKGMEKEEIPTHPVRSKPRHETCAHA